MTAPFRLGLVGTGAIARAYAAAIAGRSVARLTAVADIDEDAVAAFARDTGAAAYPSHIALAQSGACDAVIVTTPPVTHAPIVIDLAARGLHVLCEKPLSVDVDSARRMARAADDNGVLLSMASKFRFAGDVIAAHAMVRAGRIGRPLMLENLFTGVADMSRRWNANARVSGGGVLIDNGTHSVDIIRHFLGPITEVFAAEGPRIQPITVEDSVVLLARTADGAQATAETAWSYHKDRAAFVAIQGSEGAIEIGWKGSRIRANGGQWEAFGTGYDKVASFAGQVDHFVGTIRGEARALPDAADALASVAVIQAAYRSIQTGGWVAVEDMGGAKPRLEVVG
jgi:predicted dehydrogenase